VDFKVSWLSQSAGCISQLSCKSCGVILQCNSSGRAGTREGSVRYIHGPCCCGMVICSECGGFVAGRDPFAPRLTAKVTHPCA